MNAMTRRKSKHNGHVPMRALRVPPLCQDNCMFFQWSRSEKAA